MCCMSEEQLSALIAELKENPILRRSLQDAPDLDAAESIVKNAGFHVTKQDWLNHQANNLCDLNDQELEGIAGGKGTEQCQKSSGAICMMV